MYAVRSVSLPISFWDSISTPITESMIPTRVISPHCQWRYLEIVDSFDYMPIKRDLGLIVGVIRPRYVDQITRIDLDQGSFQALITGSHDAVAGLG